MNDEWKEGRDRGQAGDGRMKEGKKEAKQVKEGRGMNEGNKGRKNGGREGKGREGRDREITAHCQKRTPEITAVNGAASGRAAGRNVMG